MALRSSRAVTLDIKQVQNLLHAEDRLRCIKQENFLSCKTNMPITVAVQSKAWTVFARSDSRIVGSNHIQGMNVCLCLCLFCLSWKDSDNGVCCAKLFGFFWTLSIVWYVEVLQKTTTFRRLDLSPSSGGWGRVDILSWARQKELAPWVKSQAREAHHSHPSSAEVKNGGATPPLLIHLHSVVLNYS
jgi:hypothetical protein